MPSGILAGPMSANPLWTNTGEIYTSPLIVFKIEDASAGGYVQLLFALRYRELGAIEGVFASNVYYAFKRIESEWQTLVENIRTGNLPDRLKIEPEIRSKLTTYLTPDPARADELEGEFTKGASILDTFLKATL